MPDSQKPLFSRPVLAAIMVFSTLAIWVLNLTAPNSKLPTPAIETWASSSGIPVIWLTQDQWKKSNKLELRLVFHAPTTNPQLTKTTLAILMSDSLPLSTASINQRLSPLAAKVGSDYNNENQTIGITLSNEPRYLKPTLSVITEWLKKPEFKTRTFERLLHRKMHGESERHQLEQSLFTNNNTQQSTALSVAQVQAYYHSLKAHSAAIFIIGPMNQDIQKTVKGMIDKISEDFQPSTQTNKVASHEAASATTKQGKGSLWQTRNAIALTPLTNVKDWISLQLWGTDLVQSLNKQEDVDFTQLNLTLSQQHPWAWWNIQHSNALLVEQASTKNSNKTLKAKDLISVEQLPSANNKDTFNALLDTFKKQLEQQTLSPTWWSYIATQVTYKDGPLTLQNFADGYKEAIDTYTQDDYKTAIQRLLKVSSYQEIQVYQ
ncbi:insulinase family protein [Marinomonas transparens]|uniref:Insulinase family protein n=1 Tax=Marinomonas transparens TaxID=2795388 RepID=A0A934N1A8_9GAMM|nr:insulinase family protein [Marinomonas transparens]MBJ7536498.1 insulinase family protein [Marinomonas transparens]